MSHRKRVLVLAVGLVAGGCVVPDVDLAGRPCPCVTGWVCDEDTNTCLRSGGRDAALPDGSPRDGSPMDASSPDASRPDAGTDSGADGGGRGTDGCIATSVTETWGDTASSDWPGTVQDTWINLNREHHAGDADLRLYTWPAGQVANAIVMKWDLSAIPAGATITDATLELYLSESGGAGYRSGVHEIVSCPPDIAGDTVDGYQCSAGVAWTPNSCCSGGVPMGQGDLATPDDIQVLGETEGYQSWDVTRMAQRWVDELAANLGLMINSDEGAAADAFRTFRASEHVAPEQRPRLTVSYDVCDA